MGGVDRIASAGLDAIESQVAIVDADGLIVYTNEAWDTFGRENGLEGEAIGPGDDYLAVCGTDDESDLSTACTGLGDVLEGSMDRFDFEYPCHSPDEKRWFIMKATPFEVDDERYAIVMHVDITERKLAEISASERTEQLEMVARLLSHDLRNPLNVAMGRLELDGDTDIIARQLDRMADIIDNALVIARGTGDVEREQVDFATLAEDAWSSVETMDATLTIEDTGPIAVDTRTFPHLLENLFRNSIQHAGPDITVTVGLLDDGFYVEDDGPGLPDEDIFEAGVSTSGSGLGLAIVRAIADGHGWQIETPDADGARFEFRNR